MPTVAEDFFFNITSVHWGGGPFLVLITSGINVAGDVLGTISAPKLPMLSTGNNAYKISATGKTLALPSDTMTNALMGNAAAFSESRIVSGTPTTVFWFNLNKLASNISKPGKAQFKINYGAGPLTQHRAMYYIGIAPSTILVEYMLYFSNEDPVAKFAQILSNAEQSGTVTEYLFLDPTVYGPLDSNNTVLASLYSLYYSGGPSAFGASKMLETLQDAFIGSAPGPSAIITEVYGHPHSYSPPSFNGSGTHYPNGPFITQWGADAYIYTYKNGNPIDDFFSAKQHKSAFEFLGKTTGTFAVSFPGAVLSDIATS